MCGGAVPACQSTGETERAGLPALRPTHRCDWIHKCTGDQPCCQANWNGLGHTHLMALSFSISIGLFV